MTTSDDNWGLWLLVVFGSILLMAAVALLASVPFAFIGWALLAFIGIFFDFTVTYAEYVATGIIIALIISWRTR